MKNIGDFLLKVFILFLVLKFSVYLNRQVFVMNKVMIGVEIKKKNTDYISPNFIYLCRAMYFDTPYLRFYKRLLLN